jgi:hypothetical protein
MPRLVTCTAIPLTERLAKLDALSRLPHLRMRPPINAASSVATDGIPQSKTGEFFWERVCALLSDHHRNGAIPRQRTECQDAAEFCLTHKRL